MFFEYSSFCLVNSLLGNLLIALITFENILGSSGEEMVKTLLEEGQLVAGLYTTYKSVTKTSPSDGNYFVKGEMHFPACVRICIQIVQKLNVSRAYRQWIGQKSSISVAGSDSFTSAEWKSLSERVADDHEKANRVFSSLKMPEKSGRSKRTLVMTDKCEDRY
eukprot:TRINITY_DN4993_c0_g3_i1.p1 TRINITY_DN4993_c0_g3~~TRINITY_DN4993_c0_g3_i1.p1  ORF type:complete len:163 (+),score=64.38 TRINITY_DN4993_c0_g3_i1:1-489(+)